MLQLVRSHKLIVFLSLLVLLFPASFIYEKYLDWDNAQMIKGIARDFPELVKQIEAETGLDLEEKSDCMTTSEKFSAGVKTCEFLYTFTGASKELISNTFQIVEKSKNFERKREYKNSQGYIFNYRNKESCSFNSNSIIGSCVIGIRDANTALAKNLLIK